ncbi:hypothetical protein BGZ95_003536 [Linnemannia exigua]|uniref:LIM zinc-binding domain-containing protein n=1 Tax=Linnemannia exigua TaxID=604196 RepID=A0AAD4H9M8_9FUNG|nr:hypothetical protein BGZ95_003536 [Linnemannia exigua]
MSPLRSNNNISSRPALPFLEKYAKMSKAASSTSLSSPPAAPLAQSNSERQDQSSVAYGITQQQQQQYQQYQQQQYQQYQQQPRTPGHYRREQNDYFPPKTPTDDRFAVAAAFAAATSSSSHQHQQQYQDSQPVRSYAMGRSKTPTNTTTPIASESATSSSGYSSPNSSFSSRTSQYTQPALPQKSNARSPSISSVHALGVQGSQGYDYNARSKSSLGNHSGSGQSAYTSSDSANRDRERERMRERANRSAPIPDYGSQYSHHISTPTTPVPVRSGSNASSVSTVASRRANRERSNTMQSEQSEITLRSEPIRLGRLESNSTSDRFRRSDREKELPLTPSSSRSGGSGRRIQDAASAFKTPSPPVSLKEEDEGEATSEVSTKGSSYRPLTPPEIASPIPTRGRRPSIAQPTGRKSTTKGTDQFDALMEDLLQQIDILPTSSSPSSRSSTRHSTRDSTRHSTRSRSRSLVAEGGRVPMDIDNTVAPPTPRLPNFSVVGGGNSSIAADSRSDSPSTISTASARSQQRRLERERSELSEREHANSSPRPRRERSDSGREREREERDKDRESIRDRDRTRSSTSTALSSRSRSAHPTTTAAATTSSSISSSSRSDPRTTAIGGNHHACQGCQYDIRPSESLGSITMDRVGEFHAGCFKCTRCRKLLDSERLAHEFEGRPYCDKDYSRMVEKEREKEKLRIQRRRLPTCAGCDGSIHADETTVYALGQTWHDRHLQCYHCRKPIPQPLPSAASSTGTQPQRGHIEKNGRVYCSADYASLFQTKCRGCNKPVEKEAVSAQDGKLKGKWHTACFGCHTCHRPFPDKSFYVFGDAPYCRRHYHKMNNSLCKTCDEPIEGPCAQTVEGWRFHPHCFSCAECRTPLTDIYYNFENKAYCERDIAVIQRTRNVRAERRRTFFGKV